MKKDCNIKFVPINILKMFACQRKDFSLKCYALVSQSCPTLFDSLDYSLPGSSVHGILQARILEWDAIPFSRGSSRSKDRTQVSCIASRLFTNWATRGIPVLYRVSQLNCSFLSDSLRPHGLWPVRLLCPWDSPGKNTGMDCHSLLQGSSQPRDWTQVSCTAGKIFTNWAIREDTI